MTKDVKVNDVTPVTPGTPVPLKIDPALLAAIQAAVSQSVKEQLAQQTPQPQVPAPHINQSVSAKPVASIAAPLPLNTLTGNYTSKLKGIPVNPGEDLRHVPKHIVEQWFHGVETRWKDQYNKRKVGGAPVDLNWTRG